MGVAGTNTGGYGAGGGIVVSCNILTASPAATIQIETPISGDYLISPGKMYRRVGVGFLTLDVKQSYNGVNKRVSSFCGNDTYRSTAAINQNAFMVTKAVAGGALSAVTKIPYPVETTGVSFSYTKDGRAYKLRSDLYTTSTTDGTGDVRITVPAGFTKMKMKLWGCGGSKHGGINPAASYGGSGAYVEGEVTVSAGQVFTVSMGEYYSRGLGSRAGHGGALVGVFSSGALRTQANALLIAGSGGAGADSSTANGAAFGGHGGYPTGSAGSGAFSGGAVGGVGTQTAAGTEGGAALKGGNCAAGAEMRKGGGGAGYFGGGGGQGSTSNSNGGYAPGSGGATYFSPSVTEVYYENPTSSTVAPNAADAYYMTGVGVGTATGLNGLAVIILR
jgi:hypothetical protein